MSRDELAEYFRQPRQYPARLELCQGSEIVNLRKYMEINLIRLEGPPRLAALAEENLKFIYTKIHKT